MRLTVVLFVAHLVGFAGHSFGYVLGQHSGPLALYPRFGRHDGAAHFTHHADVRAVINQFLSFRVQRFDQEKSH